MGFLSNSDNGVDGNREVKGGASEETICSHPRSKTKQGLGPVIEVISV